MDHESGGARLPSWYWAIAAGALLWEIFGCVMFAGQMSADHASLPLDQRAIWDATPIWSTIAYGVAVSSGLVGTILLLLRRPAAVTALGISLIAVLIQFSALVLVPTLSAIVGSDMLLMPIVIALVCYGIFQFSLLASRKGWLAR